MARLFEVTLVLALAEKSRSKLHEHQTLVVLADERDEAVSLALASIEEKVVLAQVEDLGSNRVAKVGGGRAYSRGHVLAILQTPNPEYVIVGERKAPPVRPSMIVGDLLDEVTVVYSDHYLTGHGKVNDTDRNRERRGVVRGWKFYDAEGSRSALYDPEGSCIVDIEWDNGWPIAGCHIDNLSVVR